MNVFDYVNKLGKLTPKRAQTLAEANQRQPAHTSVNKSIELVKRLTESTKEDKAAQAKS